MRVPRKKKSPLIRAGREKRNILHPYYSKGVENGKGEMKMLLDEIDSRAEWEADAREEIESPYFARMTISGKLLRDEWCEIESILDKHGVRVENIVEV